MTLPELIHEIAPLILKFLRNDLTYEECLKLNNWMSDSEKNEAFIGSISVRKLFETDATYNAETVWSKLKKGICKNESERFCSLYQIDKTKVIQCEKLVFQVQIPCLKTIIGKVVLLDDEFESSLDLHHLAKSPEMQNIRYAFSVLD